MPPQHGSDDMEIEQLVLPKQCYQGVLQLAHTIPLAGHLGKDKTAQRILQRFYWPTIYKDVADYCCNCEICQKSSCHHGQQAPLIPLPVLSEPFKHIAMDIIGSLHRSPSGKRYVLVICDYATRYPEAIPLHSTNASHIAEELIGVFAKVGIPSEILTDQGSNFTSQLLTELYRHPQTDGLVERLNQTLKSMLRKAATKEGRDWDKMIPFLLFAYREVLQSSTGFSPFELLYGKPVRGPLDVLRESWEVSTKSKENVVSYVLATCDKLDSMYSLVTENMQQAQKTQKEWYDHNACHRQLAIGDQVLVLLPTDSNKLLWL